MFLLLFNLVVPLVKATRLKTPKILCLHFIVSQHVFAHWVLYADVLHRFLIRSCKMLFARHGIIAWLFDSGAGERQKFRLDSKIVA